jgi:hypothetical protein
MFAAAILCYEAFPDLVMSLDALMANTPEDVPIIVFDNSEKTPMIKRFAKEQGDRVHLLTEGKNLGCTKSRNIIYHKALEMWPDLEYLCILDQDIEVLPNWSEDMLEVMDEYPDCGIVAWPQAHRYTRAYKGGVVSEVASMCNMHRVQPLREAEERWGGPFDERFFIHKFDSLICQRLNQLEWRTRLVMKYYKQNVAWEKQKGGIVHHHPHRGVKRNPKCGMYIQQSKDLYSRLQKEEGWKTWVPPRTSVIAAAPVSDYKPAKRTWRQRRARRRIGASTAKPGARANSVQPERNTKLKQSRPMGRWTKQVVEVQNQQSPRHRPVTQPGSMTPSQPDSDTRVGARPRKLTVPQPGPQRRTLQESLKLRRQAKGK